MKIQSDKLKTKAYAHCLRDIYELLSAYAPALKKSETVQKEWRSQGRTQKSHQKRPELVFVFEFFINTKFHARHERIVAQK